MYQYATHFRRQLKARLLKDRIVTQIVRETTLAPNDFLNRIGKPLRRLEDPATVAWKILTGAYYKDGGRPWQLANVRPGVCYVGLAYKRQDNNADDRFACCAAQMFLSSGEGVVFRGALGPWFQSEVRQFHLNEDAAHNLARDGRQRIQRNPWRRSAEGALHSRQIVVQRRGVEGFEAAAPGTNVVGIQIADAKDRIKLFRPGTYPIIRGTALIINDFRAFLWTAGIVRPATNTYLGPETPNPIEVRIQRGNCESRDRAQ